MAEEGGALPGAPRPRGELEDREGTGAGLLSARVALHACSVALVHKWAEKRLHLGGIRSTG